MTRINIAKNNPEVADFIKLLARDSEDGRKAREAFAAFVGPVVTQVLDQSNTYSFMFRQFSYNLGEAPSIPLEYFDSNTEGLFDIWSTSIPGGLPTNHVTGVEDFRMTTMRLDAAMSMLRQHAEQSRLDVVATALERLAQEVLIKQEFHAWSTVMAAAAKGVKDYDHVLTNTTAGAGFQVDDFNRLKVKASRARTSWVGGSPVGGLKRNLTHLVVSPEVMGDIRGWSYQPMDTQNAGVPLTDQVRNQIWSQSGLQGLWDVGFIDLSEMGLSQPYNDLFGSYYNQAPAPTVPFTPSTDELILGVDLGIDAGVQISAIDADGESTFMVEEDDQWVKRSGKIGWFGYTEGSWAWIDGKAFFALILK